MTERRQHDWQRLDEEYFECSRCHAWSRTRHDGECSVEVPTSSAAEPVPVGRSIRQEGRAAEFSRRQAEESAKRRELQLRDQRFAEAKKRKEQRDVRALKRKRARRPVADWGEREDVWCEPIERREPIDQNTTIVEVPAVAQPAAPRAWPYIHPHIGLGLTAAAGNSLMGDAAVRASKIVQKD